MLSINPEFKKLIPPLTADEFQQLEANCLAEGIRDAIVVWDGYILDGHNRYEIAQKHGLEYRTIEKHFESIYDAKEWMFVNQLGRRNLTELQKTNLIGQRYNNQKQQQGGDRKSKPHFGVLINTAETIAKDYNIGKNTVERAADFATGLEHTTPELEQDILQGNVKVNKGDVQELAKAEPFFVATTEDELVKKANEMRKEKEKKKAERVAAEKAKKDEMIKNKAAAIVCDFVHNISILDAGDILPQNIKLLLTDPPYGMAFKSNRRVISAKDEGIAGDDSLQYALDLLNNTLALIEPNMAANSFAFVFTGWRYEPQFRAVFERYFTIKNSIIWVKPNHGTGDLQGSFAPKHERILFGVKGNPKLKYRLPDVLDGGQFETSHPASKPIDLLLDIINVSTNENDIIIEPFAGHGSTILAALKANRKIFATEIDPLNYNNILNNIYGNN